MEGIVEGCRRAHELLLSSPCHLVKKTQFKRQNDTGVGKIKAKTQDYRARYIGFKS